jgi:hypothetical protein
MNEDSLLFLGIVVAIIISLIINYVQKYIFKVFKDKTSSYFIFIFMEVLIFILFFYLSLNIVNYIYGNYVHYISDIFYHFIPIYSIYNIFRIIALNNKKRYFKHSVFTTLQFIVINLILSLIVSIFVWNIREVELIEITKLINYTFLYVFIRVMFYLCIISYLIVHFINVIKFLNISKYIYIRLIPLKIIFICIFLFFTNGWDGICLWDILADTKYSENFNIYNIDKIYIGMEKEKVFELIGDPLSKYNQEKDKYYWTSDGKSWNTGFGWFLRHDFAWFHICIIFYDNKVEIIDNFWAFD